MVQTRVGLRKPATAGLTGEIARVAAVNEVILFGDFQNKEQLLAGVITEAIALQNQALARDDQWNQNLDIHLYLGAKSLGLYWLKRFYKLQFKKCSELRNVQINHNVLNEMYAFEVLDIVSDRPNTQKYLSPI
ncbi:MAG: hypothetical protein HWQ38_10790 [Nostoc sp. NMS7]|uniref:hypothetical protein n=1 Tax=Nostoc sp. NMS7 TaxID=2815391 RepID=UPI0025DDEBBD|nr:hypothetical protein [Nostoc sp. NMS7]MBN3946943.1 hypothetical protein [Nostoc sp. NMS7]